MLITVFRATAKLVVLHYPVCKVALRFNALVRAGHRFDRRRVRARACPQFRPGSRPRRTAMSTMPRGRKEYSHLRDHIIANEDFTKHPRDLPRTTSALPSDLTSQTKTFLHIENSHDLISFV